MMAAAAAARAVAGSARAGSGAAAAAARRRISSFGYVRPGAVPTVRHVVKWREIERAEVWASATIPWVESPVPVEGGEGRVPGTWNAVVGGAEARLEALQEAHPHTFLVAALREALAAHGSASGLDARDWVALTAAPSSGEVAALATREGRAAAVEALAGEAEKLVAAVEAAARADVEGGVADLSVPLPAHTREALQVAAHGGLLRSALTLARSMSLVVGAMDGAMTPVERASLRRLLDTAPTGLEYTRLAGDAGFSGDAAARATSGAVTATDAANADHFSTYAEVKQEYLAHRDRTEIIPRKRLPPPLHADAPTRQLEDVARLVDANPSFTAADKAYILQHYADAVSGKASEAFDWAAEKAAIVTPQPQWAVYDPEHTALSEDVVDAARGAGKYSKLHGYAVAEEAVPAASVGSLPINPRREVLTAGEEVSAAMAAYDAQTAARLARVTASITEALGASLGVAPKAVEAGGMGASPRQVAAARAKLAAGAASSGGAADGAVDPKAVMASFFKRYLAGEPLPKPGPPLDGPRKALPVAAAEPVAAKGKGGKPGAPAAAKKK